MTALSNKLSIRYNTAHIFRSASSSLRNLRVRADSFLLEVAHSTVAELGADDICQQVEVEKGALGADSNINLSCS